MPRVTIWDDAWGAGSPQVLTTAFAAEVSNKVPGLSGGGPSPATARVSLAGKASDYLTKSGRRQLITVEGAVNGAYETVFTGLTNGPSDSLWPRVGEIEASGYLSLAQAPLNQNKSFHASNGYGTDGAIIRALLGASGIPEFSVSGSAYTVYTASGHVLRVAASDSALNVIGQNFSRYSFQPVYDTRTGSVEYDRSYVGSYTSEWTYKEGSTSGSQLPMWNARRPQPYGASRNLVRVLGYIPSDPTIARPNAGRRDTSAGNHWTYPTTDNPHGLVSETIPAEALESSTDCAAVALNGMYFWNRGEDVITFDAPPNPYLEPMTCFDVASAPSLGISGTTQYMVIGVRHSIAGSWVTQVTAMATALGSAGSIYSLAPAASFTFSKSIVPSGNGITNDALFVCTSTSVDADGQDATDLTLTWSVNVAMSQQTGIGATTLPNGNNPATFTFRIPQAIDTLNDTVVTLTATNRDRLSASVSQNV